MEFARISGPCSLSMGARGFKDRFAKGPGYMVLSCGGHVAAADVWVGKLRGGSG